MQGMHSSAGCYGVPVISGAPTTTAPAPLPAARASGQPIPTSATCSAADPLQRIREGTRSLHQAIDETLPAGLHDRVALLRYLRAMRGLSHWLSSTPAQSLASWQADWRDSERDEMLRDDLHSLGAGDDVTPALPAPLEASAWIGGSYVIEGSALGGRLLLRQALSAAERDPPIAGALRFLRHHTRDPSRWRRFVAALQAMPPADVPHAVEAARRGFALTHHLLSAPETQNG